MNSNWFFVLVLAFILTLAIRTRYDIQKFRRKLHTSRKLFWIIFTNMCLLWLSWFGLCDSDPNRVAIAAPIRYAGLTVSIAGIVLFLVALWQLKFLESDDSPLIKSGIYRYLRHPMYLAFLCWLLGYSVFTAGMVAMIMALAASAVVMLWRWLEEQSLLARLPEYREYKSTTWF